MDVSSFKAGVNTDIITKTNPKSITGAVVGAKLNTLADLTATNVNQAINGVADITTRIAGTFSQINGVPDTSFNAIPGTSATTKWTAISASQSGNILEISFNCVADGQVSFIVLKDNGNGTIQQDINVDGSGKIISFAGCTAGSVYTFSTKSVLNPNGYINLTIPQNGYLATIVNSSNLGRIGSKGPTANSSYSFAATIGTASVTIPTTLSTSILGYSYKVGAYGIDQSLSVLTNPADPVIKPSLMGSTGNVLNQFDKSLVITDRKLATTGIINSSSIGYGLAKVVGSVGQIMTFKANVNGYYAFFSTVPTVSGSTGMIGSAVAITSGLNYTVTYPAGSNYLVLSLYTPTTSTYLKYMVNFGSTLSPFTPYIGQSIYSKINGVPVSATTLENGSTAPYQIIDESPATVRYVKNVNQENRKNFVVKRPDGSLQTLSIRIKRMMDGILASGKIANTNAWPQGKMCSYGNRIYAAFNSASDHGVSDAVAYSIYSDDFGNSWSSLKIIKQDPGTNTAGTDCWSFGVDNTGKLYSIIRNRASNNNAVGSTYHELYTSTDSGSTWTLVNILSEITQGGGVPEEFHDMVTDGTYMYAGFHFSSNYSNSRIGVIKISIADPTIRTTFDLVAPGGTIGRWVEPTLTYDSVNNKLIGGFRQQGNSPIVSQFYYCNTDGTGYNQFAVPSNISVQFSPLPVKIIGSYVVFSTIERFNNGNIIVYQMPLADFYSQSFTNVWSAQIGKIIDTVVTGASENGVQDMEVIGNRVFLGFSQQRNNNASSVFIADFDLINTDNLFSYNDLSNMAPLASI